MAIDRDKILQAAQKWVEKKRWDKAIAEWQRLVDDDPKDARTLLKIGDAYLKLEQYPEAIGTYERVGQFYSMQGFALKAIAVYKQIREIIKKHVPHMEDRFGHIVPRLAEIYTQLGLTSDALAAYDEVASRLMNAGRDRDAIDIFKKVVDLDPNNPLPYLRLGEAFVRVRDYDNALARFGAAAEILLKLGRRDDALKVVERLLQHRPDAKFARIAAEIYLDRGQPNDGMAALTKLQISFKENPKDLDTLALLARAFDKLGQGPKAVEVQKEAAKIAREAGKTEAFDALVAILVKRAPNDEGVKQLVAGGAAPVSVGQVHVRAPTAPPSSDGRNSIDVEVDDAEEVLVEDVVEISDDAPFQLGRKSMPSIAEIDPVARARTILSRADAGRRTRDYDATIALLRAGVAEVPGSRELREKLCDVLLECGDQAGSVREMLAFATYLAGQSDVEGAARVLDEVLLLEPDHPDAVGMLQRLGYALPTLASEVIEEPPSAPATPYSVDEPLPSYDLEEVSADQALSSRPPSGGAVPLSTQLDDPFATESPLPSFPMEEEATQFMQVPPKFLLPSEPPPRMTQPPPAGRLSHPGVAGPLHPAPGEPAALDEDALEEIEFFAHQGMLDEARGLLDEQLARLPNHPLLLERKRELQALAAPQQAAAPVSAPRASARAADAPLDRSFDIAASLDALDALEAAPESVAAAPAPVQEQQVSVETVFEQFKAGVAAQISESDAATHYDLGVAYKEMGLQNDAVSEFELAARDPNRECVCWSMIGEIRLQLSDIEGAIDAFIRGVQSSVRTPEQEIRLQYEIANAYEARGNLDQALYWFQLVKRTDPEYNDPRGSIANRVRRLEPLQKKPAAAPAQPARASGDFAEFDEAFDELFGKGTKLP